MLQNLQLTALKIRSYGIIGLISISRPDLALHRCAQGQYLLAYVVYMKVKYLATLLEFQNSSVHSDDLVADLEYAELEVAFESHE